MIPLPRSQLSLLFGIESIGWIDSLSIRTVGQVMVSEQQREESLTNESSNRAADLCRLVAAGHSNSNLKHTDTQKRQVSISLALHLTQIYIIIIVNIIPVCYSCLL